MLWDLNMATVRNFLKPENWRRFRIVTTILIGLAILLQTSPFGLAVQGLDHLFLFIAVPNFLIELLALRRSFTAKAHRLPPGPRGWPIVGNVGDMPKQQEWTTFSKWARDYGDLVYINVFGKSMISVNSAAVAHDLFDSRSTLYSDRCEFPMMTLMGSDWFFGNMRYGDKWRWHRKTFHQHFSPTAVTTYRDIETKHTRMLLRKLYSTPKDFRQHLRYLPGAIIMEVVYGIQVLPSNDPYIKIAETSMGAVAEAGNPGRFLVDVIPMLRHVPEWMPGASFRRKARIWRESIIRLPMAPYEAVKEALRTGTARPCVLTSLMEEALEIKDPPPDIEEYIRNTAGAAYGAGADTTVSAITSCVLAMVLNQEAQRKAQDELDSVIGDRLPEFGDRNHLPYVSAICKEVHRWHPVGPLGIAHAVTQDDVYGEYFIPGGSILFPNAWAMLHDEKVFGSNPEEFRPERFLVPGIADPSSIAFGFGRRICPGRHLAEDSIFIVVASILKLYTISLAKDAEGNEIPVVARYTSGFISAPEPFECAIKLRSASAERLFSEYVNG